MFNLDELIPQQRYFRFDYLKALKALLHRGKMWQIPLPIENEIRRVTVTSAEGFGLLTLVVGGVTLQPAGIVSEEDVSSGLTVSN